jgi:hypothetical protein
MLRAQSLEHGNAFLPGLWYYAHFAYPSKQPWDLNKAQAPGSGNVWLTLQDAFSRVHKGTVRVLQLKARSACACTYCNISETTQAVLRLHMHQAPARSQGRHDDGGCSKSRRAAEKSISSQLALSPWVTLAGRAPASGACLFSRSRGFVRLQLPTRHGFASVRWSLYKVADWLVRQLHDWMLLFVRFVVCILSFSVNARVHAGFKVDKGSKR